MRISDSGSLIKMSKFARGRLKPLSYLIVAVIFFFLAKSLFDNWQQIDWNRLHLNFYYLGLSLILAFGGFLIAIYLWRMLLANLGQTVDYRKSLRIVGKSLLGKYLPGKVWMFASRVYLAEQEKLSKSKVLLASLVEQLFVFLTAVVLSILLLGSQGSLFKAGSSYVNLGLLVLAILLLNPITLTYILKTGMRIFKIEPEGWSFKLNLYFLLLLGYTLCWLLQGIGFFFLAKSFYTLDFGWLKKFLGTYFLSWVVGFATILSPGGLGIREGSMTLLLQSYFPTGFAVGLSLLTRIWITILELILVGLAFIKKSVKAD